MLALLAAANFLLIGPLMVGIPVLAQTRFTQGAAAFGLLISAYGLGNLGGMVAAGSRRPALLAPVLRPGLSPSSAGSGW